MLRPSNPLPKPPKPNLNKIKMSFFDQTESTKIDFTNKTNKQKNLTNGFPPWNPWCCCCCCSGSP
jgi:hypothetical protein